MNLNENDNRRTCPRLNVLSDYLFGSQDNIERHTIEFHIKSCPHCKVEISELKKFVGENVQSEVDNYYRSHGDDEALLSKRLFDLIRSRSEFFNDKIRTLVDRLNEYASDVFLPIKTGLFDAQLASKRKKDSFIEGDDLIFSIFIPIDGFLIVFQYDNERNLDLLFPRKKNDMTRIDQNREIQIGKNVTGPPGRRYVKALLIQSQIFPKGEIVFDDDEEMLKFVEKLNKIIIDSTKDKWMAGKYEYEVVQE